MNTTAQITPSSPSAKEPWPHARHHDRPLVSKPPSFGELLEQLLPMIFVVPLAGPPVILLLGPLLLIVLLLIPPAAVLITLALVLLVATGTLVALVALLASPYLLVRHLRARHPTLPRRFAFVHRRADAAPVVGEPAPNPGRSSWLPAPVAGGPSPQASFASSPDSQHIPPRR